MEIFVGLGGYSIKCANCSAKTKVDDAKLIKGVAYCSKCYSIIKKTEDINNN